MFHSLCRLYLTKTYDKHTFLSEGSMKNIDENQVVESWLSTYSELTRKAYRKNLSLYYEYCESLSLNPMAVTHTHLEAYKEELLSKYSTATVAQAMSTISSYFDFLEKQGVVKNNPVNLVNKENLKVKPYITTKAIDPMGVKALLDSIDHGTPSGSRDSAIISLLFFHGIKISYAIKIRMKDFIERSSEDYLVVLRKDGTRDEVRLEPYVVGMIEDALLCDIREELGGDDLVFLPTTDAGKHLVAYHGRHKKTEGMTIRALQDNLKRYAKAAGFEGVTLNSIYQAGAYYRHRMGMEEEQVKYYMDYSRKSSIRRFLHNRDKVEALCRSNDEEETEADVE